MTYVRQNTHCQYPDCGEELFYHEKSWCGKHNTPAKRLELPPIRKCRHEGCESDVRFRKARYCERHCDHDMLHAAAQKRYYDKNKEYHSAYMKEWNKRNPDYFKTEEKREYNRQWYADNKERIRESYKQRKNQWTKTDASHSTLSPATTPA